VVGVSGDPIDEYLVRLRASLRTAPEQTAQIMAEAEDHLRESAAAGEAAGLTGRAAQEMAIASFGSVEAVVRAHNVSKGQVAIGLVMTAWKLAWVGLFSIAASGLVALGMNHLFGRSFVGGAPAGTAFGRAQCQYWLSIWPGAHTCGQAAMLESSSDALSLRLLGGGLGGLVLLVGYLLAQLYWRRARHVRGLPSGFFPLSAAAVFAVGALALVVCTFTGGPLGVPAGPGSYLSGALVALAMAVTFGVRARRAAKPHSA
jgi:hypothetical protein